MTRVLIGVFEQVAAKAVEVQQQLHSRLRSAYYLLRFVRKPSCVYTLAQREREREREKERKREGERERQREKDRERERDRG
jgi:hypothetical protein